MTRCECHVVVAQEQMDWQEMGTGTGLAHFWDQLPPKCNRRRSRRALSDAFAKNKLRLGKALFGGRPRKPPSAMPSLPGSALETWHTLPSRRLHL